MPSLCRSTESPSKIRDCLIELQTNYRFTEKSGIHRLSLAVNRGAGESALSILKEKGDDDCCWMRIPPAGDLSSHLKDTIIKYFKECMDHLDNKDEYGLLFDLFDRFRILCALRRGPYGVAEINRLCEQILFDSGLIRTVGSWYPGCIPPLHTLIRSARRPSKRLLLKGFFEDHRRNFSSTTTASFIVQNHLSLSNAQKNLDNIVSNY